MTVAEYNRCVDELSDRLYRFACKNVQSREYAKDVVQQSFEVLWLQVAQVSAEKAKSFLFTVAYRKMIDEKRKYAHVKHTDEIPHEIQTSSFNHTPDLKNNLQKALMNLNETQRQLVLLKDYEGYSYSEIAEISGLNEGQVKINLFRARKTLKEILVNIYHHI